MCVFSSGSVEQGCLEGPDVSPPNVVDRFRMDPTTLQLDKTTKEEIWRSTPGAKQNHNGGAIAFGSDGKLYITTGDGGNGDSVQDLGNTHGSLIRLNDDGSVPPDNPYADSARYESYRCADSGGVVPPNTTGAAVCSEVFANGFRNPFRLQMVDDDGDGAVKMAISDVGGNEWEELNWAGTDYAGKNYGYPDREGPCRHGTSDDCLPGANTTADYQEPFHWYAHRRRREGGCVAGSVAVPESAGWPPEHKLLVADFIFFEIYSLIEDPAGSCRTCRPPLPAYRNETLYTEPPPGEEGEERGSITDIVFGPYKDTQALYVFLRGGKESVIRIRYTADTDNAPPVPVIGFDPLAHVLTVGEELSFDGSESRDPNEGDELAFAWDFGDGASSDRVSPTHSYENPGEFDIRLVVTDAAGISQQTSIRVAIGSPPTATILFPPENTEFFVGQVFELRGEAFDSRGDRLDDTSLTWEVRKHHADHFHPFLDPTPGNGLELFPAPEPEDFLAATNSYLRIILKATDSNGLTTEVDRVVEPSKIRVDIESNQPGVELMVDAYPIETSRPIVSWRNHTLKVAARDQLPSYRFRNWWDGSTEGERSIVLDRDGQSVRAFYCAEEDVFCVSDGDCCNGWCEAAACTATTDDDYDNNNNTTITTDDDDINNDNNTTITTTDWVGGDFHEATQRSNDLSSMDPGFDEVFNDGDDDDRASKSNDHDAAAEAEPDQKVHDLSSVNGPTDAGITRKTTMHLGLLGGTLLFTLAFGMSLIVAVLQLLSNNHTSNATAAASTAAAGDGSTNKQHYGGGLEGIATMPSSDDEETGPSDESNADFSEEGWEDDRDPCRDIDDEIS